MQLQADQRLDRPGGGSYVIGALRSASPWLAAYDARKVFWNYRFRDRTVFEAEPDEWLQVIVRVPVHPPGQSAADLRAAQEMVNFEIRRVLSHRDAGLFPEPLDFFRMPDPDLARRSDLPGDLVRDTVLVLARPHGQPLDQWRRTERPAAWRTWRIAAALLDSLESLHQRGQVIGALGPEDLVIDSGDRIACLASDRVREASRWTVWARSFPAERYPAAYRAPELAKPAQAVGPATDLYSWAALVVHLVIGRPPAPGDPQAVAAPLAGVLGGWPGAEVDEVADLFGMARALRRSWPEPPVRALSACLAPDPAARPRDAAAVRDLLFGPARPAQPAIGWNRWVQRLLGGDR